MKELVKGVYLSEIELPKNPLKYINNYIIKSQGETLMIDTAFNTPEIIKQMRAVLTEHLIDLSELKLFLTHLHSDHTGLASWFEERGTTLLMGEVDGEYVRSMVDEDSIHWNKVKEQSILQGLAEDDLLLSDHPGFKFRPKNPINYQALQSGDHLQVGDFNFQVIDLKGHTPGLLGLHEKEKKLLFCGDHILSKITPNITFWGFEFGDILGTYFDNLKKVYEMDLLYVFGSHREQITDYRQRIDQLFKHHEHRLDEIIKALESSGPMSVREITKAMSWDISAKNWDEFPKSQKWFAAGEAHAHLEHLVHKDIIKRDQRDGVLYYAIA